MVRHTVQYTHEIRGGTALSGTFRKIDETLQQNGPMDEEEQASIIQAFEDIQIKQTRSWRVR